MKLDSVRERQMIKNTILYGVNSHQCICETLRMIYDEVHEMEDKEKRMKTLNLLIDAVIMAKRMSERLDYYYKTYTDKTGHGGKKLVSLPDTSKKLQFRRARRL